MAGFPSRTKLRENGVSSVLYTLAPHSLHPRKRNLEVQDQRGRTLATYETHWPGRPDSRLEDICNVCHAGIGIAEEAMLDRVRERNFRQQDEDPGLRELVGR